MQTPVKKQMSFKGQQSEMKTQELQETAAFQSSHQHCGKEEGAHKYLGAYQLASQSSYSSSSVSLKKPVSSSSKKHLVEGSNKILCHENLPTSNKKPGGEELQMVVLSAGKIKKDRKTPSSAKKGAKSSLKQGDPVSSEGGLNMLNSAFESNHQHYRSRQATHTQLNQSLSENHIYESANPVLENGGSLLQPEHLMQPLHSSRHEQYQQQEMIPFVDLQVKTGQQCCEQSEVSETLQQCQLAYKISVQELLEANPYLLTAQQADSRTPAAMGSITAMRKFSNSTTTTNEMHESNVNQLLGDPATNANPYSALHSISHYNNKLAHDSSQESLGKYACGTSSKSRRSRTQRRLQKFGSQDKLPYDQQKQDQKKDSTNKEQELLQQPPEEEQQQVVQIELGSSSGEDKSQTLIQSSTASLPEQSSSKGYMRLQQANTVDEFAKSLLQQSFLKASSTSSKHHSKHSSLLLQNHTILQQKQPKDQEKVPVPPLSPPKAGNCQGEESVIQMIQTAMEDVLSGGQLMLAECQNPFTPTLGAQLTSNAIQEELAGDPPTQSNTHKKFQMFSTEASELESNLKKINMLSPQSVALESNASPSKLVGVEKPAQQLNEDLNMQLYGQISMFDQLTEYNDIDNDDEVQQHHALIKMMKKKKKFLNSQHHHHHHHHYYRHQHSVGCRGEDDVDAECGAGEDDDSLGNGEDDSKDLREYRQRIQVLKDDIGSFIMDNGEDGDQDGEGLANNFMSLGNPVHNLQVATEYSHHPQSKEKKETSVISPQKEDQAESIVGFSTHQQDQDHHILDESAAAGDVDGTIEVEQNLIEAIENKAVSVEDKAGLLLQVQTEKNLLIMQQQELALQKMGEQLQQLLVQVEYLESNLSGKQIMIDSQMGQISRLTKEKGILQDLLESKKDSENQALEQLEQYQRLASEQEQTIQAQRQKELDMEERMELLMKENQILRSRLMQMCNTSNASTLQQQQNESKLDDRTNKPAGATQQSPLVSGIKHMAAITRYQKGSGSSKTSPKGPLRGEQLTNGSKAHRQHIAQYIMNESKSPYEENKSHLDERNAQPQQLSGKSLLDKILQLKSPTKSTSHNQYSLAEKRGSLKVEGQGGGSIQGGKQSQMTPMKKSGKHTAVSGSGGKGAKGSIAQSKNHGASKDLLLSPKGGRSENNLPRTYNYQ